MRRELLESPTVTEKGLVVGRPRKAVPAYRQPMWRETPQEDVALQVERLAAQHMSRQRIAVELGTSPEMLRRWFSEDPVLEQCFQRGRASAEHELYMLIVDGARDGEKLNMNAVYGLNNRHGWRTEQQGEPRVGISITLPAPMTPEEYLATVKVVSTQRAEA